MQAVRVLLLLAGIASACAAPLGDWQEGVAKSWGGPQDGKDPNQASGGLECGSCGYGELQRSVWPFWSAAAISPASPLAMDSSRLPKSGCGACIQLQCIHKPGYEGRCPDGSDSAVTVQVVDTCTDCDAHKMAIHYLAFNQKLADPGFGEVAIRYRQVECTPGTNITLDIDLYRASEGGYIRLAVENAAGSAAVQGVELRASPVATDRFSMANTQWRPLTNTFGGRWEMSGLPTPPLDMRIIGDNSQLLVVRQAIKLAGATGSYITPVQFSTSEMEGTSDGAMAAPSLLLAPAQCNDTLYSFIQRSPELSTLLSFVDKAGASSLLQDVATHATLFAPTNAAWRNVSSSINLADAETLQYVLLFLLAPGQIVMPDVSMMLPEDMERGGVKLYVDTLQGSRLTVVASPDELKVADGSHLTSDAIVVTKNELVCNSVVNVLSEVPMPFP